MTTRRAHQLMKAKGWKPTIFPFQMKKDGRIAILTMWRGRPAEVTEYEKTADDSAAYIATKNYRLIEEA